MTKLTEVFQQGLSYAQYRSLNEQLVAEGRTTGPNQSEAYLEYTRQNLQRMKRNEKVARAGAQEAANRLQSLTVSYHWLVFTEAWCGDAANLIPVLAQMADASESLEMKLIMRDEHPELFEQFLTNGSRSIPKLVVIDPMSGEALGSWGPRPAEAQELVLRLKFEEKAPFQELYRELTLWYARDKGRSTREEVVKLMEIIAAEAPIYSSRSLR